MRPSDWRRLVVATALVALGVAVHAQPPLGQMSGIPLPDGSLPDGTVTVRVVRGAVTNNVAGQPVELRMGEAVETATTDAEGRATFQTVSPGASVQASTIVDSQLLQSETFPAPGRGGVRIMLVAGDVDPGPPLAAAGEGPVAFGTDSWIQVEIVEEAVEAYFYLDLVNPASTPVQPATPLVITAPEEAQGTTVLRSSSPQAVADGGRIELRGPFPPGSTPVHFAYILPYAGDSLALSQTLPADLQSLLLSIEKWGDVDFSSALVQRRMEIPPEPPQTSAYLMGGGPSVPAGRPVAFELTGLPYRNRTGSYVAIGLVVALILAGALLAGQPSTANAPTGRRKHLEARRERLYTELVKVERQRQAGKIGDARYASRRSELVRSLEKVYREVDDELASGLLGAAPSPSTERRQTA